MGAAGREGEGPWVGGLRGFQREEGRFNMRCDAGV